MKLITEKRQRQRHYKNKRGNEKKVKQGERIR